MAAEAKLQRKCILAAKKWGWKYIKIIKASENGWPDCLFFRRGVVIFVEFKAPDGITSYLQELRHWDLAMEDIPCYVIKTYEEFERVMHGNFGPK